MTRHKALHTGLGNPSPLDRWINALLRGLAMLVSFVARRFASRNQTSAAECDGRCDRLPEANFVLDQHQEPTPAAASSHVSTSSKAKEVLMVSRSRSDRPSTRGRVRSPINESSSALCRGSRFSRRRNSHQHPRCHNRDLRDFGAARRDDLVQWTKSSGEGHGSGLRLPENDPWLGLRGTTNGQRT
jgi:hypothetical protein